MKTGPSPMTAACLRTMLSVAIFLLAPAASAIAGDLETAQQVAEALREGGMKHYSVGIGCKDGNITLRGTVASNEQRILAIDIARSIGTGSVVDQLQVGHANGSTLSTPNSTPIVVHTATPTPPQTPTLGMGITLSPITQAIGVGVECGYVALRDYLANFNNSFDIELDDGSRIVALSVLPRQFELETELGTLRTPFRLVESVDRKPNDPIARVRLRNGDVISGRIRFTGGEKVRLVSKHGEISVDASAIVRLSRREQPRLARN